MAVEGDLPPIWEAVDRWKGKTEVMAALNQILIRGLPSCCRLFGGRAHFNASLPLLVFIKKISLCNLSLDPDCTGGGVTPWLTL